MEEIITKSMDSSTNLEEKDLAIQALFVVVAACFLVISLMLNLVCIIRCCLIQHYKEYADDSPRMEALLMMSPEIAWHRGQIEQLKTKLPNGHRRSKEKIQLQVLNDIDSSESHAEIVERQYSAVELDSSYTSHSGCNRRAAPKPQFNVTSHPSLVSLYDKNRRPSHQYQSPIYHKNPAAAPLQAIPISAFAYNTGSLPYILLSNPSLPDVMAASIGSLPPVQENCGEHGEEADDLTHLHQSSGDLLDPCLRNKPVKRQTIEVQQQDTSRPWSWTAQHYVNPNGERSGKTESEEESVKLMKTFERGFSSEDIAQCNNFHPLINRESDIYDPNC